MIRTISKFFGVSVGVGVLGAAFLAYFVRSVDSSKGLLYDGLGRLLTQPPSWASLFLTNDPSWAGLWWHLADIVWFFGGAALAFKLYDWGEKG